MNDLRRYEQFGWDYEAYNALEPRAVEWYRLWLEQAGGPVLELACGRGPLLQALAESGADVTGLDLSGTMLGFASERRAALPAEVRDRITLVHGDMAAFDLGRVFRMAVIADNSFRELETREALSACLSCVREHLEPGGLLLLTERRFDPTLQAAGARQWPWTEPRVDPRTGALVRRRVRVTWEPEASCLHGLMTYEVTEPEGRVRLEECPYVAPVLTPAEYLAMLRDAGLVPRLFVGYEERPDDGREPILCFVSERNP